MSQDRALAADSAAALDDWLQTQIRRDRAVAEAFIVSSAGEDSPEAAAERWGAHRGVGPEMDRALDAIADCDAKLALLEEHSALLATPSRCRSCRNQSIDYPEEWEPVPWPCTTFRLVGTAYRHRDGYWQEWKP